MLLAAGSDNALIPLIVAFIGAAGTAFAAWLYNRREGQKGPIESRIGRNRDRFFEPDPVEQSIRSLHRRVVRLERWKRHVIPVLHKVAEELDWEDPELFREDDADDDDVD